MTSSWITFSRSDICHAHKTKKKDRFSAKTTNNGAEPFLNSQLKLFDFMR